MRESNGDAGRPVRNLGKPVDLATRYFLEGADEVTFLNITGWVSALNRPTLKCHAKMMETKQLCCFGALNRWHQCVLDQEVSRRVSADEIHIVVYLQNIARQF